MTDVILKLPIQAGAEAQAFGQYLFEFMERRARWLVDRETEDDAPFLMVRADPVTGDEAKILIFQEDRLARQFSTGWERRRSKKAPI